MEDQGKGQEGGGIKKRHGETFGTDDYIHHPDYDDEFTLYTLKCVYFFMSVHNNEVFIDKNSLSSWSFHSSGARQTMENSVTTTLKQFGDKT